MNLTFDPEAHIHRIDGEIVPGVTSVLNYFLPDLFAQEWHRQRGQALHKATELFDAGRLDWSTVHPEIAGKVKAWEKFRSMWPKPIIAREKQVGHDIYRYAGIIDAVFLDDGKVILCDIKSAVEPKSTWQLGGYSLCYRDNEPTTRSFSGVVVELHNDETYRCHWISAPELRQAERTFLNLLGSYNAIRANYPERKA